MNSTLENTLINQHSMSSAENT